MLHDAHVQARDVYCDDAAFDRAAELIDAEESRWVDNGCSAIEDNDEYYEQVAY